MEFQIAGSTGRMYTIKRGRDGVIYCSCPAWKFQKVSPAARACKHTRQVAAQFAQQMSNAN